MRLASFALSLAVASLALADGPLTRERDGLAEALQARARAEADVDRRAKSLLETSEARLDEMPGLIEKFREAGAERERAVRRAGGIQDEVDLRRRELDRQARLAADENTPLTCRVVHRLRAARLKVRLQPILRAAERHGRAIGSAMVAELAAGDRLERACKDQADASQRLFELSDRVPGIPRRPTADEPPPDLGRRGRIDWDPPAKIDGRALSFESGSSRALISVGRKDGVREGFRFTVYRGEDYVTKLVVERVHGSWSVCRELKDFRKRDPEDGDLVSTRVFD